jgi:hypothetical protein
MLKYYYKHRPVRLVTSRIKIKITSWVSTGPNAEFKPHSTWHCHQPQDHCPGAGTVTGLGEARQGTVTLLHAPHLVGRQPCIHSTHSHGGNDLAEHKEQSGRAMSLKRAKNPEWKGEG